MDSPSRKGPGSDEEGGGPRGDAAAPDKPRRVVRTSRPLARPAAPKDEGAPRREGRPAAALKPGDRLWSRPKRAASPKRADSRLVYLSTEEYEANEPRRSKPAAGKSPSPGPDKGSSRPKRTWSKSGKPPTRPAFKAAGGFKKPVSKNRPARAEVTKEREGRPPRPGRPGHAKDRGARSGRPDFSGKREFRAEEGSSRPGFRPAGPFKHTRSQNRPSRPPFPKDREDRKDHPPRSGRPVFSGKQERRAGGGPSRPGAGPARGFQRPLSKDRPARPAFSKNREVRAVRPERPQAPPGAATVRGKDHGPKPVVAGGKGNVRASAAKILHAVLEKNAGLKPLLQSEQQRYGFEADRALLREMTAGVLRRLPHLDWCIEEAAARGLAEIQPELTALLRVGIYQVLFLERVPVYAAVDQCVEAAKAVNPGAARFVNGVLRGVADRRAEFLDAPFRFSGQKRLALRFGMPEWIVARYAARFGEAGASALLEALQRAPATGLVFSSADSAVKGCPALETEGISLEPDGAFPLTFHAEGGNPADSEPFRQGLFYVCDPASQVPARLLPVEPGEKVLDLCAAPGGKTVLLSQRMGESGSVMAVDNNRRRIRQVRENVTRLRLRNVRLVQADASSPLPFRPEWRSVLLDAPCSSLGTLRNNPEIRWQVRAATLELFRAKQGAFLGRAAAAVAPGGHLLYAVCSIEPEETTEVAAGFLASRPEFAPAPLRPPAFLESLLEPAGEGAAFCLPHRHRWDGFFVALFRRRNR